MKKFRIISLYSLLSILVICSCEKTMPLEDLSNLPIENEIDITDLKYNDDFIEFENQSHFRDFATKLQNLSYADYLEVEKAIGFESIYGNYLRILEVYSGIESQEELKAFFDENQDKVNFVEVEEGFTDIEPLLTSSPRFR